MVYNTGPSKIYQKWDFWYANRLSSNPDKNNLWTAVTMNSISNLGGTLAKVRL
jgi:hypothetical protein